MSDRASKWRAGPGAVWAVIVSPWRFVQSVRRSMTGASVTVLLIGIITLNIVWGYPWTGMFAASVSLLLVGYVVNRLMGPRLRLGFSLPTSAPAGDAFAVVTHVENRSRLPTMDLHFRFADGHERGDSSLSRRQAAQTGFEVLSPPHPLSIIHPGEHVDLSTSIRFGRRGIHELPEVVAISTFPFYLFRCIKRLPQRATIAITPRPIAGDEDAFSRDMLSALGGWSHRLLAGDALDYTGSREYQEGMPVRRWDFASWARLGRPIVREFQSPSIQAVTVILDAGRPESSSGPDTDEDRFERLLSVAATAINELARKMVLVRLYISAEDSDVITGVDMTSRHGGDCESQLIRLAAAELCPPTLSDPRTAKAIEHVSLLPVVVLTLRPDAEIWQRLPSTVTVLRADPAHRSVPMAPAWQARVDRDLASVSDRGG